MTQSRAMSAVEATANVIAGLLIGLAAQCIVFPAVGLEASLSQNIIVSLAFAGVSLVRSFALRRFFETARRVRR